MALTSNFDTAASVVWRFPLSSINIIQAILSIVLLHCLVWSDGIQFAVLLRAPLGCQYTMLGCETQRTSLDAFSNTITNGGDSMQYISRQGLETLSRAARRTVRRQQQALKSLTPRKIVTARIETRRKPDRRGVVSAPANVRLTLPVIVVEEATVEDLEETLSLPEEENGPTQPEFHLGPSMRHVGLPPATAPECTNRGEELWEEHEVTINRGLTRTISPTDFPNRLTRSRYQTASRSSQRRSPPRPGIQIATN